MIFLRRFFKIILCVTSAFAVCLSGAAAYGRYFLPDEAATHGKSVSFNGVYYAESDISVPENGETVSASAQLKLMNLIPVKNITINASGRRYVSVGGELIGIKLNTDGLAVAGTESFESPNGNVSPAKDAGIKTGDIIMEANGKRLKCNSELTEMIQSSGGKNVSLVISRNGGTFNAELHPEKSAATGLFKAGIWIRDSVGGIGTLTYSDTEHGTLAALGHGIFDSDTGTILPAYDGYITSAVLSGVEPGKAGTPGQLCGSAGESIYGVLKTNSDKGIYGLLDTVISPAEVYPVADANEVHTGPARIICTVSDRGKQFYDIYIEKAGAAGTDGKDMIIKVTDASLLGITGGIVRGMSGSPIIQDGMFVGAVTHVFINDPARGYGIFASRMLEQSDAASAQDQLAA